ncbi:probable envelope ADP,ATP carrier protein, chloroplastic [Selaginella moellendorffii]|nr:probable envelope ADP,ATP carrier protein, chloroplastic [Selaginella moellendorffii]|eukprot:XP_002979461.2 probable envelope ADP,ATP carrier protein, chloroplastic [Selaginella moellendorffii]
MAQDNGATVLVKAWERRPRWMLNNISLKEKKPVSEALDSRHKSEEEEESQRRSRIFFGAMSFAKNVANVAAVEGNPRFAQLLTHPVAFMHFVPRDLALFFAGALAGATAKSVTAPLDRVKLLMQVQGLKIGEEGAKKATGFIEAIVKIGQDEGLKGYWKGNLPQVIRVIPYSAMQLFAYETYKKLFKGTDDELSVLGRLAAGGCAGMTSTLVTYPLDVLRLRLAVDPVAKSMTQVALEMLREEGLGSFYKGLGPSLMSIAPYIAVNFCVFDLMKKTFPEDFRKKPQSSFLTAIASATVATLLCYPLDTVRRQMQMKGTPFGSVLEAFPGIIERDGVLGLYRGFVPNALKNLPNSSIRLTTFDAAKNLIQAGESEYQKLVQEKCDKNID